MPHVHDLHRRLCAGCYGRALGVARTHAATTGAVWAESVCRGDRRTLEAWPDTDKARAIAARKVASLAVDPRMVGDLVEACMRGAAAWWRGRPARYRT